MSILSAQQRAVVRASTGINEIIIDRVCDAFDALERDDVEAYKTYLKTAMVQQGPVKAEDRPTAVDKVRTICLKSYADKRRMSVKAAAARIEEQLRG